MIEPSAAGTHIWWLGQSGFLIGHEGRHLLVDPYLSDSLTAKYEGTETPHVRMHPRVVAPEQLAFVDVVLSTHGHTDHLDGETLRAIGAPLVAPAGIVELARERSGGEVTAISRGRDGRGRRLPRSRPSRPCIHGEHCVGYVIEAGARRLYHSGDTSWVDPGVRGVDVALVPINGKLGNLDGPEAARLAHDGRRGARRPVPLRHVRVQHGVAGRVRRASASGSASPTACCGGASGSRWIEEAEERLGDAGRLLLPLELDRRRDASLLAERRRPRRPRPGSGRGCARPTAPGDVKRTRLSP